MRRERMFERKESAGTPVRVADATLTPLASSLIVRWPGGGAVWSGPAAITVEREEGPTTYPS